MQRSSETIGAIAAALRRRRPNSQSEKALVATIRAANPRDQNQTFRYAALSSGLDNALGGHEIATVQATAIDNEAGLIRLTTTLAHGSGEWLSSEWSVCPIAETVMPRRMAGRYYVGGVAGAVARLLGKQPPAMVMEACATAHDWGRAISGLGHDVRLVPPIYIKPFVRRQEQRCRRRGDRRGGLKADDALCGVEDGRAASATHDLSHARPFGAAANPVGQCTARPSGGAWDRPRPRACPGESSWRLRCETRAHSTRSCAS